MNKEDVRQILTHVIVQANCQLSEDDQTYLSVIDDDLLEILANIMTAAQFNVEYSDHCGDYGRCNHTDDYSNLDDALRNLARLAAKAKNGKYDDRPEGLWIAFDLSSLYKSLPSYLKAVETVKEEIKKAEEQKLAIARATQKEREKAAEEFEKKEFARLKKKYEKKED